MTNVLLISSDYIKTNSSLNENFFSKNLISSIREAQDIGLQSIIGECLYKKLLSLVSSNTISLEQNIQYKELLDEHIRTYLLYLVLSNSVQTANVKFANIGTVLTNDEHIVNLTQAEADLLRESYQNKCDFYCKRLQSFLLTNYDSFPELKECECNCAYLVKPNLINSTSCDIYLGGLVYKN